MSNLSSPEVTFFPQSPVLTMPAIYDRINRWEMGEVCQSGAVAVGRIALAEEHTEILSAMERPYMQISIGHIDLEDLTDPERALCLTIRRAFGNLVMQDAKRSGIEEVHIQTIAGRYAANRDMVGKHVDSGPGSFRQPRVRWVESHGLDSTTFYEGDISKAMFRRDLRLNWYQSRHLRRVTHPPGTVLRFMSNIDIHEGLKKNGPRLFHSATASLPSV